MPSIVVDATSGGVVTHIGVALTFGMIVMVMIHAVGEVSGAHFNPAVTIGFAFARRLPTTEIAPYLTARCAGHQYKDSRVIHLIVSRFQ